MKKYLPILKTNPLFFGIENKELLAMLHCVSAYTQTYKKGEYIYHFGAHIENVGIVLQGSVHLVKEDYWGNRNILSKAEKGKAFGEIYACFTDEPLHISVVAVENTEILFMNIKKITSTCTSSCVFHTKLIQNLVQELANKALMLTKKIDHISQRTTREKLLSYLLEQSRRQKSSSFTIPFNRQQLADYLSVERSAMTNELSKMRKEGLIDFEKNEFILKQKTP